MPTSPKPQTDPKFSRTEAAAYLGVSVATLAQDVVSHRHRIPFQKIGRRCIYPKTLLDMWLESRTVNSPVESVTA